ncbi:hypothetical protein NQ315_011814 [Exocentrus adspersus]|uniref:27 kDa hemolymph protein n=1 Tax=Exocentrus adspersus TaxID=1586481 RepID=A0AAV8W0Q3_9CUCU|nr:hypothetical protein NQ315_011814 [Exocentrus adspersus]
MKVLYQVFLCACIFGYATCQSINDLDVEDVKKKLGDAIPELDGLDTSNFNTSKLPKQEDVENVLKEKCKKQGAENAVDKLKDQQDLVKGCVESHVNYTVVIEELEEAKKTGSMDEVFGKYCKKWPSIYSCFDNVTATARLCMDDKEEKAFNKSQKILNELQEFMCFKDGDRLAMFVAEGGVECVQEQKEGVQNCINSTVGTRIPDSEDFSVTNLPTFLFSAKDCQDFDKIRVCVNNELEKCKDSTPANIVDAFFKFLKKHMPCTPEAKAMVSNPVESSHGSFAASLAVVIVAALSLKAF